MAKYIYLIFFFVSVDSGLAKKWGKRSTTIPIAKIEAMGNSFQLQLLLEGFASLTLYSPSTNGAENDTNSPFSIPLGGEGGGHSGTAPLLYYIINCELRIISQVKWRWTINILRDCRKPMLSAIDMQPRHFIMKQIDNHGTKTFTIALSPILSVLAMVFNINEMIYLQKVI